MSFYNRFVCCRACHTTRGPYYGEEDGSDYHFVTEEEFQNMIQMVKTSVRQPDFYHILICFYSILLITVDCCVTVLCPFICRNRLPEVILVYKAMTCQKCEEEKEFALDSLYPQAPQVLLRERTPSLCRHYLV